MLKEELTGLLAPYGQEHLLRFWDELSEDERKALAEDIRSVDWKQATAWFRQVAGGAATALPQGELTPAPYQPLTPPVGQEKFYADCRAEGERLLREGKVAAFTVAGGQGTRLGYDGPKGTYKFTILQNKSLFQYFAETLRSWQRKYQTTICWYIMTSPANNQDTVDFFQQHCFFGLQPENVKFFIQGVLPVFSPEGKALLADKFHVSLAANGHGGSFTALRDSGALADMASRGVEILTYWQVDNPLVAFCDTLFLGMHRLTGSEMSSRALIKRDAMEKLGHFCLLDGRTTIIEYSDMPKSLLEATDADGRLTYRAGSPAIHVIDRQFVERLTDGSLNLPPHRAQKKISFIDEHGEKVIPTAPNAVKLELFLFDALPLTKKALILEGDRETQFSPIKNAAGQDSPDSCRAAMLARDCQWLEEAGIAVPRRTDGTPDVTVEISPLAAVCPEDLAKLSLAPLQPGEKRYIAG